MSYKWWSTKEIDFIRKNLHLTDVEIAEKLGRSRVSVINARNRHNIRREEMKLIPKCALNFTAQKISEMYGISIGSIKYQKSKLKKVA